MKNLLIVLLLILLAFFAYSAFIANNAQTQDNANQDVVVTDNSNSADDETVDEITDPVDSPDDTDQDVLVSSAPCQDIKDNIPGSANFVITTELTDGATVSNGDTLSGCIYSPNNSYGNWAPFEGQIGSYEVLSGTGDVLGSGPIPVVPTDWMTPAMAGDDIEYSTTLDFDATGYTSGSIVMRNENASGDPATEELITITVNF